MFGLFAKVEIDDLVAGDGRQAVSGDTVRVHYTGKLDDGSEFDSSHDRGEPFVLTLGAGEVIKGWDRGIAGMCEGGTRRLVIPPSLGYGRKGVPGAIPPNARLTFDVELVGFVD